MLLLGRNYACRVYPINRNFSSPAERVRLMKCWLVGNYPAKEDHHKLTTMITSGLYLGTTWAAATSPLQAPAILLPQATIFILNCSSILWSPSSSTSPASSSWSTSPQGVSAVSSESCCSRKSSIARDFSFSSLSNFQVENHLSCSPYLQFSTLKDQEKLLNEQILHCTIIPNSSLENATSSN